MLARIQAGLEDDFEADPEGTSERMFAAGECFHATTETADQVAADVAAMFPGSCIRTLGYPTTLWSGETPASAWDTISRAAIWPCVTVLKRHVGSCCRGLKWKLPMCMEIKNLAIQQQLENPQRALSAILGRVDENEEVLDDEGEPATPTLPTKPEDMSVVDLIVAMASDRVPPIGQGITALVPYGRSGCQASPDPRIMGEDVWFIPRRACFWQQGLNI